MDNFSFDAADGRMIIKASGKIDSANAGEFEKGFFDAMEGKTITSVLMDAAELEYLSSAGLRGVFSIKDAIDDFSIINVSDALYDIFDVTGFTKMIDIKKA